MKYFTTIILWHALFVHSAFSAVSTFKKALSPNINIPSQCNPGELKLEDVSTNEINFTVNNGLINLVPLDVCGEIIDGNPQIEGCNGGKPKMTISFKVAGKSTTLTETIGGSDKTFCIHMAPCELLSLFRMAQVKLADLPTVQVAISATFEGQIKATNIFSSSHSLSFLATEPSWKLTALGSLVQSSSTATLDSDETLVGSIAAIRHESACLSKDCGFTIGKLDKHDSKFLKYIKDSEDLPECIAQIIPEGETLDGNLHSVIDYFKVGNLDDKIPVETTYKIVSSLATTTTTSTSTTTTSTSTTTTSTSTTTTSTSTTTTSASTTTTSTTTTSTSTTTTSTTTTSSSTTTTSTSTTTTSTSTSTTTTSTSTTTTSTSTTTTTTSTSTTTTTTSTSTTTTTTSTTPNNLSKPTTPSITMYILLFAGVNLLLQDL